MATSEAKEIKKQETLVRFSIISYKTRLRVCNQSWPFIRQVSKSLANEVDLVHLEMDLIRRPLRLYGLLCGSRPDQLPTGFRLREKKTKLFLCYVAEWLNSWSSVSLI